MVHTESHLRIDCPSLTLFEKYILLQVRRIADLYFMMKLWKPAYNYYYIAKKDFQSDEAWPYYASAVECAALSMFMLSSVEPGIT